MTIDPHHREFATVCLILSLSLSVFTSSWYFFFFLAVDDLISTPPSPAFCVLFSRSFFSLIFSCVRFLLISHLSFFFWIFFCTRSHEEMRSREKSLFFPLSRFPSLLQYCTKGFVGWNYSNLGHGYLWATFPVWYRWSSSLCASISSDRLFYSGWVW